MSARQHASQSRAPHTACAATQQPGHAAYATRAQQHAGQSMPRCAAPCWHQARVSHLRTACHWAADATERCLQQQSVSIQALARHERPAQHSYIPPQWQLLPAAWPRSASTSTHQHAHLTSKFPTEQSSSVQCLRAVKEHTSAHNCATHGDDAHPCSSSNIAT